MGVEIEQITNRWQAARYGVNSAATRKLSFRSPVICDILQAQGMGDVMRTIRLLPLVLALALAGCLSDSEKANLRETLVGEAFSSKEEIAAKDDAVCRGYGAQPGTSAYVQCRVVQDQRRDADRNAARANAIAINNEPVRVGR